MKKREETHEMREGWRRGKKREREREREQNDEGKTLKKETAPLRIF